MFGPVRVSQAFLTEGIYHEIHVIYIIIRAIVPRHFLQLLVATDRFAKEADFFARWRLNDDAKKAFQEVKNQRRKDRIL